MQAVLQPVQLHGSLGREAATGRGTVFAIRELLKHSNAGNIANKTYVIQVCGYSHVDAESPIACVLVAVIQVCGCCHGKAENPTACLLTANMQDVSCTLRDLLTS